MLSSSAPRADAWPGTALTTDEMVSTIGGNGFRCNGADNCERPCDPYQWTEWNAESYWVCAYDPPGSCENDTDKTCTVKIWSLEECSGTFSMGYHVMPSCQI